MGFTWIFGFVASFSGIQFFWYPYIVLNSLQGALVCVAFVCNDRVIKMWRAKLASGNSQQSACTRPPGAPRIQKPEAKDTSADEGNKVAGSDVIADNEV